MRRGVRPWPSSAAQLQHPCHILARPFGGNAEAMSQNPKDVTESIDVGFSLKACLQPYRSLRPKRSQFHNVPVHQHPARKSPQHRGTDPDELRTMQSLSTSTAICQLGSHTFSRWNVYTGYATTTTLLSELPSKHCIKRRQVSSGLAAPIRHAATQRCRNMPSKATLSCLVHQAPGH